MDGVPLGPGKGYPSRPGIGYPPRHGTGYPLDLGPGTPQTWDWVPPRPGTGYPPDLGLGTPPDLGPGTPLDQVWIRQNSTASTCYVVGGVPLAFRQEDFLVFLKVLPFNYESIWLLNKLRLEILKRYQDLWR